MIRECLRTKSLFGVLYSHEKTTEKIGCIPAYWSEFVKDSFFSHNLKNCSRNQYNEIQKWISLDDNRFDEVSSLYLNPCVQMTRAVHSEITHEHLGSDKHLFLKFKYDSEWYKEIVSNRAFTAETFFGQVGGYIGMY